MEIRSDWIGVELATGRTPFEEDFEEERFLRWRVEEKPFLRRRTKWSRRWSVGEKRTRRTRRVVVVAGRRFLCVGKSAIEGRGETDRGHR